MNWCVIKHKWVYKTEDIVISSPYIFFNGVSGLEVNIPTKIRLCSRCHKKQRSRGIDWVDWELSLEEEREKKLKELGI
jgi:hypothetical protein